MWAEKCCCMFGCYQWVITFSLHSAVFKWTTKWSKCVKVCVWLLFCKLKKCPIWLFWCFKSMDFPQLSEVVHTYLWGHHPYTWVMVWGHMMHAFPLFWALFSSKHPNPKHIYLKVNMSVEAYVSFWGNPQTVYVFKAWLVHPWHKQWSLHWAAD